MSGAPCLLFAVTGSKSNMQAFGANGASSGSIVEAGAGFQPKRQCQLLVRPARLQALGVAGGEYEACAVQSKDQRQLGPASGLPRGSWRGRVRLRLVLRQQAGGAASWLSHFRCAPACSPSRGS